jgi:hypothetical protein
MYIIIIIIIIVVVIIIIIDGTPHLTTSNLKGYYCYYTLLPT